MQKALEEVAKAMADVEQAEREAEEAKKYALEDGFTGMADELLLEEEGLAEVDVEL